MLLMAFPAALPKINKHAKGESTVTTEQCCIAYSFMASCETNKNLKQNEAQSARAESTHKGGNWRSTQVQQRPESSTVTHLACV